MKNYQLHHTIIIMLFLASLVSCDNHDRGEQDIIEQQVTSVSVSRQQRKSALDIETRTDDDMDDALIIDSFDDSSLLYFSQLGPTGSPNFSDEGETASPYLYIYEYKKNEDAEWKDGYNFSVLSNRKPLDWSTVKNVGSVGNAFSLYAFYFPGDQKVRFNVEDDQTKKDNFMKSDIMGAYHATSSLYTRLRFRLFHLMVYLKVTLYVPDYEYIDNSYSGYKDGDLKGAYVLDAYTNFDIEWRANRSSDTEAPLTKATGSKSNIKMYGHPSNEQDIIIEEFDVTKYYTKENMGKDKVRVYNFSVLFPNQSFSDNFLCFALQSPVSDEMKYYYFSASQIISNSDSYGLTQGTLQQLYLYLPRKTNETILVGAKILPWSNGSTEMTVTQQGNE